MFSVGAASSRDRLVLTFDTLLQRSSFVPLMKGVLSTLSQQYHSPVDIEFAISLTPDSSQAAPYVSPTAMSPFEQCEN